MKGFRQGKRHLDEVYVKIDDEMHYLWRAVYQEGEILETFLTKTPCASWRRCSSATVCLSRSLPMAFDFTGPR